MENLRKEIRRIKKHRLDYYGSLCDVVEKYVEEKPDVTIETCKSIIEGISKLSIHLLAQEPLHKLNSCKFEVLFKQALKEIGATSHSEFEFDESIVNRFGSTVGYLAEIRNEHGDISHGKASLKEQKNDAELAEMVIGITDSVGTYMLRKLDQLVADTRIQFSENEEFNQYLDELYPMDGYVRYSRALYEQDYSAYGEQLAEYVSEMDSDS